jgi:hypothetical protein
MSVPSTITLTSHTTSLAGLTFAIVGTDELGNAISSETALTGPGAGLTVTSVQKYATVSSVIGSAANAGTLSIGVTSGALTLSANQVSVAAGQALGVGVMTLAAAGVLPTPIKLTLSSAVDVSAIAFAIVGTDNLGNTISESLLGPLGTGVGTGIVTVSSVKTYASITSITPGANAAQIVGAGSLLTLSVPAQVTITDSGNGSAVTLTIVGTNALGGAQTQGIAGKSVAGTVTTSDVWGSITSITPSVTSAIDFEAGVAAGSLTAGVPIALGSAAVFGTQKTLSGFGGRAPKPAPGVPMEVTITQLAGGLANTYTIVGVDRWGIAPITEVLATTATTAATYTSAHVFSVVYSITPSVTDTAGVAIGVPDRVTTPYVQLNQTRGKDMAELAYWAVDNLVASPTFTMEGTSASINEEGLGPHGWNDNTLNMPTYYGDDAPIDSTSTPSVFPVQVAPGTQWTRLVLTSGAGTSAIARCVRPSF